MFLRAFGNWVRNVIVIGTLAGSPYTRFFGCEWCYHGNDKREKTRKRKAKWGVRKLLNTHSKNVVVRVFPSVNKVREQHQIGHYLDSPAINDYDGYKYSMIALCSECKRLRVARWVPAQVRLLEVAWRYRDGSLALSKVSKETWAAVLEWTDRWGEKWRQLWEKREGWRKWRASLLRARLAEWELEEELAARRVDCVFTDMTIDESANLGWDEDVALGDGY